VPDDQSGSRLGYENLRRLGGPLLLTTAALLCVCYGFTHTFSTFRNHDDEGNMLLSIKQFNEGRPLYDDVFSLYGPFSFLVKWGIANTIHRPIDHDIGRLICLAYWLGTSGACAGVLFHLTRSTVITTCGLLLVFRELSPIIDEPGHPQELCALLLGLAMLLPTWANSPRRTGGVVLGLGLLCGCLVMTKVNIGIFLGMALGMTLLALGPRSATTRILTGLYAACLLIAPSALLKAHLASAWCLQFATLVTLSLTAALILSLGSPRPVLFSIRHWVIAAGAFLVAIFGIVAATWLRGSSLESIVYNNLQRASKLPSIVVVPPQYHWIAWLPAPVAVAAALCLVRGRCLTAAALSRIVAGLLLLASAFLMHYRLLCLLGPPLAGFVLVPSVSRQRGSMEVFARTLLAFSAITEVLWLYPIYGGQRVFATFLCVVAAIVCLDDGTTDLIALRRWETAAARRFLDLARVALLTGLIVAFTAQTVKSIQIYRSNPPLGLPGTSLIHLPLEETQRLRDLTKFLRANSDTFITFPGLNSFYLWTGKEPPIGLTASNWMFVVDDRSQDRVVDQISRIPHPYVVFERTLLEFWMRQKPLDSPVFKYVDANFRYSTTVTGYEIWVRKASIPDAGSPRRPAGPGRDKPEL
jgi:hypothetical protein